MGKDYSKPQNVNNDGLVNNANTNQVEITEIISDHIDTTKILLLLIVLLLLIKLLYSAYKDHIKNIRRKERTKMQTALSA